MIHFSNPDFEDVTTKEWLITNGIGGYASSTICGTNTRRYHGLLVAATNPPTGRQVLLSKVMESIQLERNTQLSLSTDQYPGVVHPNGYRYLTSFERDPLPTSTFEVDGNLLSKTVFMRYGSNTSVIAYENHGDKSINLQLTPLFVSRDYHGLFHENPHFDYYHEQFSEHAIKIYAHYGAAPLFLRFTHGTFSMQHDWYRAFQYKKEAYRGLDYQEDAHCVGHIKLNLPPGQCTYLICSTETNGLEGDPARWKQEEINRLNAIPPKEIDEPFLRDLSISGDQFLVERPLVGGHTIIAGYPWFTDWGRDTMIAMRGLTIALGKKELSESIISTFLKYLNEGMIPNRFPDQGETPEYNTIDASLWLFVVLFEYADRFKDWKFIQKVFPKLRAIIEAHIKGTRYSIQMREDGLLYGGEGPVQLTWMDAKVEDFVVTPRHGCPVEINALWYNALEIYNYFHHKLSEAESPYNKLAKKVKAAFRKYFLNDKGYLHDVIIPGNYIDSSLRPNQIYALSLPFTLLSKKEAKGILNIFEQKLYTDLGLRSLATDHPDFKGTYSGNPWQRDTAYHQGTVWAFLWGEYAMAYLKHYRFSEKACEEIWQKTEGLKHHFYESDCLFAISEIFDGRTPDEGRGCVHQAWSVGMLLRVFLDTNWKFNFLNKKSK